MEQVAAIPQSQLTEFALAAIIADAVWMARTSAWDIWEIYREAKQDIDRLNPTPDEYERAIKMLADALKI